MFRQTLTAVAMLSLSWTGMALAETPVDYLGVPGPIVIGGQDYVLSWSSNPQPGYFKQEYLPEGSDPQTYQSMVMVEFLATDLPLTDVVGAQMDMINQRKSTDPVANLAVFNNDATGEILLDFILSAKDESGEFILEWNGYRYAAAEFDGQEGSILFAISERAYGNAASETFLRGLNDFKQQRIGDLTSADMPNLQ